MSNPMGARKQDKLMAMCLFPSINYTPVKYIMPLPYPVWRMLENSVNTAATSRLNEEDVYLLDQTVQPDCFGDFLGIGKGIKSQTVSDEVKPTSSSDSIMVEGKYLIRKDDKCTLNDANTFGKYTSPPTPSQLAHVALGVLSFIPVVGTVAALADAALYTAEGDYVNAGLAAASAIPGGKIVTTVAKGAVKLKGLTAGIKLASGVGRLGKAFSKGGAWIKGFTRRLKCGKCTFARSWNIGTSAVEVGIAINAIYGSPVHAMRGAKILMDDDDLDYQGLGYLPFYLQRLYNSQNDNIGWFGQGWTAQGFEQRLEIEAQQDYIYLVDNSGRRVPFTYLTAGQSCYNPFEDITLYRLPHSESDQALTLHSQLIEADAERGSRIGAQEPLRFMLINGQHKPKSANYTDYDGIAQHFNHVKSRNSRHTKAVVLPSKQMDRYGHTLQLHYTHDINTALAHLPQYITDANHNCYRLQFAFIDDKPRLTQLEQIEHVDKPATQLATYTYDQAGDLIQVHRYNKLLRQFAYTNHLITWQQLPAGLEGTYVYDQTEQPKTARVIDHTLSNGQHYRFDYIDAKDSADGMLHSHVIEQPDTPLERHHHYVYDDWYVLQQYTDPLGRSTKVTYDHLDRPIRVQDPKGGHSLYHYHGTNLGAVSTKVGVNPITGLDEYRSTRYQYIGAQLVAVQNPLGHTERLSYNTQGELEGYTDANGNRTRYAYDAHGNLITHTLAGGSSFTYQYNEQGHLILQSDCSGYQTRYQYDNQQRLITIINAEGERTEYHYNDRNPWLDNLIKQVRYPDGSRIQLIHDDAGRLIRHIDAKDQQTQFDYAIDSLPIKRIDATGHSLTYQYDEHRRLSTLTNENGEDWTFIYDAGDNLISETRFDDHQSRYQYDQLGDIITQIDNPTLARHQQRHVRYQRDLIGQLIAKHSVHYPALTGDTASKDKQPEHHRTRYRYDKAGQLISAANPNSRITLTFDKVGQLIQETVISHERSHGHKDKHNSHSQTLTHRYDVDGNSLQTTLPDGKVLNQLYYGSGHLYNQSITDNVNGSEQITEIIHSEHNKLHQERARQQGALSSSYHYDAMGRLTKQLSASHDHIAIERDYSYDVLGQLTHLTGKTQLNHLAKNISTANSSFKRNHQYQYDKVGRLTEHKLTDFAKQSGITEVFAFDPASNRVPVSTLAETANDKDSQSSNQNNNKIHKSGHPTELTTHDKYITYTYDSHGRVLFKTQTPLGKDGQPLKQSGSAIVGYRTSLQLVYNADHELTKSISITQEGLSLTEITTTYQYDAFGRRIAKHSQTKDKTKRVSKNLIKFAKNHIQQQKTKHKCTRYLWDGNRQRQEQTDTHIFTTIYEQDGFAPVARLVWLKDELLKSANDDIKNTKRESWEDEPKLIPSMQVFHYHNDHLGTPNELTNSQGEVVWYADYEAWGNTAKVVWREQVIDNVKVSQDELQPIRFQGQSFDTETGLHYNRFRYFDPDLGMFTTRDPIGLLGGNNVFQYAPNPTGWIDPFGLTPTPSTYDVGLYGEQRKGLNGKNLPLDSHHVGQKNIMKDLVTNYDPQKAPAIVVPREGHTKGKGNLPKGQTVVSRSKINGNTGKPFSSARDLLARDISELRRVYPDIPNSTLKELIDLNKSTYPEMRTNQSKC